MLELVAAGALVVAGLCAVGAGSAIRYHRRRLNNEWMNGYCHGRVDGKAVAAGHGDLPIASGGLAQLDTDVFAGVLEVVEA